jgi:succinate dehydrogenase / fumarate reductase cytochrome b subunit
MSASPVRHKENRLGIRGWVWGGKYKLERYLYILHRITGLGMILFGILHLIETTFFRIQGQTIWEATVALLSNPWFEAGLGLVVVAFVFHALNGLRLILQEFGFTLGRPTRPIYPYRDALRRRRAFTYILLGVIVVVSLIFILQSFVGGCAA